MSLELTSAKEAAFEELKKYMSPAAAANLLRVIQLQGYAAVHTEEQVPMFTNGLPVSAFTPAPAKDTITASGVLSETYGRAVYVDNGGNKGVYGLKTNTPSVEASATTQFNLDGSGGLVTGAVTGENVYAASRGSIVHNTGKTELTAVAIVDVAGMLMSYPVFTVALDENTSGFDLSVVVREMDAFFADGTLDETATCTLKLIEIG